MMPFRWRKRLLAWRATIYRLDSDKTYRTYWALHGGWRAIRQSKYSRLSLLVTAICAPFWLETIEGGAPWAQMAIDIIPGVLGLTLGGMAIMLAFSNRKFLDAIRQKGEPKSLFMEAIAAFFHFILMQTIALIFAIISKAYTFWLISGIGFFFTIYGLSAALAIAGLLLHISRIWNALGGIEEAPKPERRVLKYYRRTSRRSGSRRKTPRAKKRFAVLNR